MNKVLKFSLLWHMHQPYYKNDADGLYHMPWVYMHAIKDYQEMAMHIKESSVHGNLKVTFNYVPSLIMQLKDYEDNNVKDTFLLLLRKNCSEMTAAEKNALMQQLCMVNRHTMLKDVRRLGDILTKYDQNVALEPQEVLDASVLYLLAWTGVFLREEALPASLLKKGKYFTEEDKRALLAFFAEKIKEIIPLHKELKDKGLIELSCTPAFHPIMPLLANFADAKEAMPHSPMPELVSDFGDDYKKHLDYALISHKETFGSEPNGVWPSEGSVSPITADYYIEKGLKWIATDEDILSRTLAMNIKTFPQRKELYKQYYREKEGKKMAIFFRDKHLSDLVGFTYSSWKAEDAVANFISKLREIYDNCKFSPHVSVILDGENAWEYYPDNASSFFRLLYKELLSQNWIEMQTMSEATVNSTTKLDWLASGSWIYGNFAIWCGHSEKNKAWELLSKTRKTLTEHIENLPESKRQELIKELFVAEGSDWFWWYGDDHFTAQAHQFDQLFRAHLINIYRGLNLPVPNEFFEPIKKTIKTGLLRNPSRQIFPKLDGKRTSFYEWLGAGEFDLSYDEGSMHSGGSLLKKLYFGYNNDYLCMLIEPTKDNVYPSECTLAIEFDNIRKVVLELKEGEQRKKETIQYNLGNSIEIMIPIDDAFKEDELSLVFELTGSGLHERAPRYSAVILKHPRILPIEWMV